MQTAQNRHSISYVQPGEKSVKAKIIDAIETHNNQYGLEGQYGECGINPDASDDPSDPAGVDDSKDAVVAASSTMEKDLRESLSTGGNREAATVVGKRLAERAIAKGISKVHFDRNGKPYHGRVAALADGAREAGLQF